MQTDLSSSSKHKLASIVSVSGVTLFPSIDQPDAKFTNGKPVYRIKVALTREDARVFFHRCRDQFADLFPASPKGQNLIMPVRRNKLDQIVVLAEGVIRPTVTNATASEIRRGDPVRVYGTLVPFQRESGAGVNFRLNRVEKVKK